MTHDIDPLALRPLFEGGGEPWYPVLGPTLNELPDGHAFIGPNRDKSIVPVRELTFQALKPNPPSKWRVVIFGQNPYPRVESATGIAMFDNAFESWKDSRFGKVTSIRCIVKAACMNVHGIDKRTSTADIRRLLEAKSIVSPPEWFQAMLSQGVLLLNAALTANGDMTTARHTAFWKPVVERIVDEIVRARGADGVVFAWWGSHAKALRKTVERIAARHPEARVRHVDHCNPAAMGDAFCDGDPFGAINAELAALGQNAVDWLPATGWEGSGVHDAADAARLGDFIAQTRELHQQYLERLQEVGDEVLTELAPIEGIARMPALALADAMAPLVERYPALQPFVRVAREFGERKRADGLDAHETAALHLYTMNSVLYRQLNVCLRNPDRSKSEVWRGYLRLVLGAIAKLAPHHQPLWRGVAKDLRREYAKGRTITWWGVSSCTPNPKVAHHFLGSRGRRMLFEVHPKTAVNIKPFSAYSGEDEVILAPGSRLVVTGVEHRTDGLSKIRLEELPDARLVG